MLRWNNSQTVTLATQVRVSDFASASSLFWTSMSFAIPDVQGLLSSTPRFLSVQGKASSEGFNLMGGVWLRPPRSMKVKTESNVKREPPQLPEPPCVICKGSGRVRCARCCGRGRLNFTEQVMLPKGEWPQWCWDCRGCGLSYCTRCLGTGEKRGMMGFHFPDDDTPNISSDGAQN